MIQCKRRPLTRRHPNPHRSVSGALSSAVSSSHSGTHTACRLLIEPHAQRCSCPVSIAPKPPPRGYGRTPASPWKRGPGTRNRTDIQAARPGPARFSSPPAVHSQHEQCPGQDGHPDDDGEAGPDASHRPASRRRSAAVQPAAGHPRAAPAPPAPQVTSTTRHVPGTTTRDWASWPASGGVRLVPGHLDRGRVKRAAGAPLPGEYRVTDISVLITARLRDRSRPRPHCWRRSRRPPAGPARSPRAARVQLRRRSRSSRRHCPPRWPSASGRG